MSRSCKSSPVRSSCRRRLSARQRTDRILAALGKNDLVQAQALFRSAPPSQRPKILAAVPERYRALLPRPKFFEFELGAPPKPTASVKRRQRLENKPTVTFFRTTKFRLYPTAAQARQLETWCAATAAVYDAGNERFLIEGHKKTEHWHGGDRATRGSGPSGDRPVCYTRLFRSDGKLKRKAEREKDETLAWLNDPPLEILWTALRDLDLAWRAYGRRCRERKAAFHTDRRGRRRDDRPGFRSDRDWESFRLQVW